MGGHACTCSAGFTIEFYLMFARQRVSRYYVVIYTIRQCHDFYISECSSNNYGNNCSINCNCNATNVLNTTQSCDIVNGTCGCNDQWTGVTCDDDVDECERNVCPNSFERCINTQGGFNCTCSTGYKRNESDTCVQGNLMYLVIQYHFNIIILHGGNMYE